RGTRTLVDVNLFFHDSTFTRAGVYPDEPGSAAWAGQRFPTVSNHGGAFVAPFLGIATDFGRLDRWTFAVGVYGPPSVVNRDFHVTTGQGWPAPSRYDLVKADLLIVYPTLAAAVRATRWLDVGLALQLVAAHLDLTSAA